MKAIKGLHRDYARRVLIFPNESAAFDYSLLV